MDININGHLMDFNAPQVMGIINVTPDSFFAESRLSVEPDAIVSRARGMMEAGATILDVGAVSTRPGASPVSADEELSRLDPALTALRRAFPDALISVDTFRATVARRVVRDFNVQIINDVSAGALDPDLFATVADLRVPYVLTHGGGYASTAVPSPSTSATASDPASLSASAVAPHLSRRVDPISVQVARFFAERLQQLYALGVADVILDPGFGFGKNLEQNYALFHSLPELIKLFPDNPFLIGVSRKSMVYRLLGTTPEQALNGTTVLHTLALQAGAHILRVHDVPEAVEAVRIYGAVKL
jgi:dihydropteroate synthase